MAKTELNEAFIALRSQGLSFRKINKRIGVSKTTLVKWDKKFHEEIAQLRDEEFDQVLSRIRAAKQDRILRLVEQVDRIEDELAGRDLSDLTTLQLVRFHTVYMERLSAEIDPTQVDVRITEPAARYAAIIEECAALVAPVAQLGAEVVQKLSESGPITP